MEDRLSTEEVLTLARRVDRWNEVSSGIYQGSVDNLIVELENCGHGLCGLGYRAKILNQNYSEISSCVSRGELRPVRKQIKVLYKGAKQQSDERREEEKRKDEYEREKQRIEEVDYAKSLIASQE